MNNRLAIRMKRWEAVRKKGRAQYILLYGVICWGLPVGVVVNLINGWEYGFSTLRIIVSAVIWPIGGVAFGASMWHLSEEKYRQFIAAKEKLPNPENLVPR